MSQAAEELYFKIRDIINEDLKDDNGMQAYEYVGIMETLKIYVGNQVLLEGKDRID